MGPGGVRGPSLAGSSLPYARLRESVAGATVPIRKGGVLPVARALTDRDRGEVSPRGTLPDRAKARRRTLRSIGQETRRAQGDAN